MSQIKKTAESSFGEWSDRSWTAPHCRQEEILEKNFCLGLEIWGKIYFDADFRKAMLNKISYRSPSGPS